MIDRLKLENVILVADRGYENYNIFAHAIEKGWKFAIRVKDKNSNGIASGLNLPPNDEFDIDITQIFSRKNTKTTKMQAISGCLQIKCLIIFHEKVIKQNR